MIGDPARHETLSPEGQEEFSFRMENLASHQPVLIRQSGRKQGLPSNSLQSLADRFLAGNQRDPKIIRLKHIS